MKILILTFWCLIPLGLVAFHYAPTGQNGMKLDAAGEQLALAETHAENEAWPEAIECYEQALGSLPENRVAESREIRLAIARARVKSGGLPDARESLAALSEEIEADPDADPATRDAVLAELAGARFYMTYLMKLEGLPESEWGPEIDAARQDRALLVKRARAAGDSDAAERHADHLESAVRLARMDPTELYGQPIPTPCRNCESGKCMGQRPAPKTGDQGDARGASAGPPVDGEGS